MWLKSQYLKQSQCHFGSKTRYTPSGKKAVFGIGQRRNMLKSRYLTPAFLYAPAGCVLWYSKLSYERYSRMAAKYEKSRQSYCNPSARRKKSWPNSNGRAWIFDFCWQDSGSTPVWKHLRRRWSIRSSSESRFTTVKR